MRLLGIDPGLRITGYGCVDGDAAAPVLIEAGVFRLGRNAGGPATGGDDDPGGAPRGSGEPSGAHTAASAGAGGVASVIARLAELDDDLRALLARLRPEAVAVESLFAHYKHPATAIVMGHARGVILLAIQRAGLPLIELKPNEVKKSLTGNGHADKLQMQRSVQIQFGLASPPEPPDVADAIAIALCAARRAATRQELGERAIILPARSRRRLRQPSAE